MTRRLAAKAALVLAAFLGGACATAQQLPAPDRGEVFVLREPIWPAERSRSWTFRCTSQRIDVELKEQSDSAVTAIVKIDGHTIPSQALSDEYSLHASDAWYSWLSITSCPENGASAFSGEVAYEYNSEKKFHFRFSANKDGVVIYRPPDWKPVGRN